MTLRERLLSRGARLAAGLPHKLQVRLSGRPPIVVDGQTLDPTVQLMLASRERIGEPAWADLSVEEGRLLTASEARMGGGTRRDPVGAVRDLEAVGLRARLYSSAEPGPRPLLVFFHGGGFVVGDVDSHDAPCRTLCHHGGVNVLSVEYRLAPEHEFPAAVDDALSAFAWASDNAASLGADPDRVAVGGDSAGGNLSAVVAQHAKPALQLLIYPATDATRERRSHELFTEHFLTTALIDWYRGHHLPEGADLADPRRSPLLAEDLSGLAPAIVITAGYDPLRDEGEAYADALRAAGVPVVLRRFPGLFHGFINSGGVLPVCQAATVEIAGMVRASLR